MHVLSNGARVMSRASRFVSLVTMLFAACVLGGVAPPETSAAWHEASDAARHEARAASRQARDASHDSLAIIVNRTNPVENLSFAELRQYFLGERTRWSNGRRVAIVMREPDQPERNAVLRLIYEMREQDFHEHFLRAKFIGEVIEEPRLLDTAARVVNFVFLQPGAIGYVRAGEVAPSVKVVRVDGLMPGDANYKLTL
jgi:ABC-type phosphate transport system substrate-binding protein